MGYKNYAKKFMGRKNLNHVVKPNYITCMPHDIIETVYYCIYSVAAALISKSITQKNANIFVGHKHVSWGLLGVAHLNVVQEHNI